MIAPFINVLTYLLMPAVCDMRSAAVGALCGLWRYTSVICISFAYVLWQNQQFHGANPEIQSSRFRVKSAAGSSASTASWNNTGNTTMECDLTRATSAASGLWENYVVIYLLFWLQA